MNKPNLECENITNVTKKNFSPNEWKDITEISCGIYKIINKVDGKYYVGSSKNMFAIPDGRWYRHMVALNKNRHHSIRLQRAWNKYGSDSFEFVVVEIVADGRNLLDVEQIYLDVAKKNKKEVYNVYFISTGGECPPQIKKKIMAYWTDERRKERSEKMKGKSNPFYGKTHSDKLKKACGDRFRGKKLSEEHKAKIVPFLNRGAVSRDIELVE